MFISHYPLCSDHSRCAFAFLQQAHFGLGLRFFRYVHVKPEACSHRNPQSYSCGVSTNPTLCVSLFYPLFQAEEAKAAAAAAAAAGVATPELPLATWTTPTRKAETWAWAPSE